MTWRVVCLAVAVPRRIARVVPAWRAVAIVHAACERYRARGRGQGNQSKSLHLTLRMDFDRGGVGVNCCGDITGPGWLDRCPSRSEKAGRARPLGSVIGEASWSWLVDAVGRRRRRRSASAVERFPARTRWRAMPGVFARAIPVARPAWPVPVAGATSWAVPTARTMPGAVPVAVIAVVDAAREGHNAQGRSQCGQSISGHMKLHVANRPCERCGPTSLRLHCVSGGCV